MYGCRHELNKRAENILLCRRVYEWIVFFGRCGTPLVAFVHLPLLPRQDCQRRVFNMRQGS
jgi:hypothetical protein